MHELAVVDPTGMRRRCRSQRLSRIPGRPPPRSRCHDRPPPPAGRSPPPLLPFLFPFTIGFASSRRVRFPLSPLPPPLSQATTATTIAGQS
uniref:Uncharacterized protein n=1 Tax=Oryza rufipogon TaxID=4529 RepID=A0A0E0PZA5_ORYRU